MINYIVIALILLVLFFIYNNNFSKGIYASIFFLLLMPKNLALQISSLPAFTIHRLIMILMVAMWLLNPDVDKKIKNIPFVKILILIFIASGISSLISSYFFVSFKQYIQFLFESLFFYIIIFTSLRNEESFVPLIKTITASLFVVALIGIIERYTQFNPAEFFVSNTTGYEFEKVQRVASSNEVQATYLHRILFGIPMAIGVFYSLILVGSSLVKTFPLKLTISICLFGSGLYFSMSRGPWLAFILSAIFVIFLDRKALAKKILFVFFLSALAFLVRPGAYDTVSRLYNTSFNEESPRGSNVQWRIQVLNLAFDKVSHPDSAFNFLFGYGQGSHLFLEFPDVATTTGHVRAYESWDNQVAIILLEQGWGGVILILWLYFKIVMKCFSYCFKENSQYKDVVLLALGCQIFIILMKANVSFYAPQLIYIEFVNLAVIGLFLTYSDEQDHERSLTPSV